MAKRRKFRELEVVAVLIHQGITVLCFRCKVPLTLDELAARKVQKEHVVELELGGADMPENCRFSHKDCHAVITNGTKATTAGSSANRIGKVKRINRTGKMEVRRPVFTGLDLGREPGVTIWKCGACGETGEGDHAEHNCPARLQNRTQWPKGRKLRGKGFAKGHRPMRRKTQSVEGSAT